MPVEGFARGVGRVMNSHSAGVSTNRTSVTYGFPVGPRAVSDQRLEKSHVRS